MKKCFFVGLLISIVPVMCLGESVRFTQLVREKQRKMAELEKCMGSTKGLKIAGISTLGLSAVGVAANVVEAQKLQEYDDAIAKKNKDIETKQKAIEEEEYTEEQQDNEDKGSSVVVDGKIVPTQLKIQEKDHVSYDPRQNVFKKPTLNINVPSSNISPTLQIHQNNPKGNNVLMENILKVSKEHNN